MMTCITACYEIKDKSCWMLNALIVCHNFTFSLRVSQSFFFISESSEYRGNSISMRTVCILGEKITIIWLPTLAKVFILTHTWTEFFVHAVSHSMVVGTNFPAGKVTGLYIWQLRTIYCCDKNVWNSTSVTSRVLMAFRGQFCKFSVQCRQHICVTTRIIRCSILCVDCLMLWHVVRLIPCEKYSSYGLDKKTSKRRKSTRCFLIDRNVSLVFRLNSGIFNGGFQPESKEQFWTSRFKVIRLSENRKGDNYVSSAG
jgi:hypothetical protein